MFVKGVLGENGLDEKGLLMLRLLELKKAWSIKVWGLWAVILLATGCAPVMVPVGDSTSQPGHSTSSQTYPQSNGPQSTGSPTVGSVPSEPARQGDEIAPNSASQQPVSNSAVTKLLEDAWRYNRAGEYDRSNAVAERAMRINHTEPEIYLVMASNYFASTQLHLAEQLASQGLPLAGGNGAVKRSLQQLLVNIRTKNP